MILRVHNLSKKYGDVIALRGISFSVNRGEIVGLIGPNGAGKTTTIQSILGFLKPDSGNVVYNNKIVKSPNCIAKTVSYIPEQPVYYEELTFKEHLQLISMANRIDKWEFLEKLEKLTDILGLKDHLDKIPDTLSKGNKQKLIIASAFLKNFDLLVADEPFTSIDPAHIRALKDLFLEHKNKNKSIVLSTHLLDLAQTFCDRYVMLSKGKILLDATNFELRQKFGEASLESVYLEIINQGVS